MNHSFCLTFIKIVLLEHYCKEIGKDDFWEHVVPNEESNLENLLREPAHIFLNMVSIPSTY